MSARTWHVIWLTGLVLIGLMWVLSSRASSRPSPELAIEQTTPALGPASGPVAREPEAQIVVHVSGAVARPGLVQISLPGRVADAVRAAGGLLPTADLAATNLAAPVADGQHVHVPALGQGTPPAPIAAGRTTGDGDPAPLSVNQATVADLQALPGVGPVLAQRIVDHREASGPFVVLEDLLDVPGIGEGRLAELRKLVTVP